MATFDSGLLGFPTNDEERLKAYMLSSLRPDMYDRTQQIGGVNLDWLNTQPSSPLAGQQTTAPQTAQPSESQQNEPVKGLLGNPPAQQQQEDVQVTQQVNPVTPQGEAQGGETGIGQGGGAAAGAASMASSAEAANQDAAVAGKELEAKKENMTADTESQARQMQAQKNAEAQSAEGFLGGLLGLGLNMLIPGNFFLKKAGIMGNKGSWFK